MIRDIRTDNLRARSSEWTDAEREARTHESLQRACAAAVAYAERYEQDCVVFKSDKIENAAFLHRDARFAVFQDGEVTFYFRAIAVWCSKRARKLKEKKQDTGVNSITGKERQPKPRVNKRFEALKRKEERKQRRKRL